MLHAMYDAIKCVLSMFVIYECNVCACTLISCNAEENKSFMVGDNEILDCCRENKSLTLLEIQKSLIAEDEKSLVTVGD